MDSLWRGLLNLDPQQYLAMRHTLWVGQVCRLQFQACMRIFQQFFWYMDGCFIPISMHKVWRSLGLSQNRVEKFSSLQHEVAMRW